MPLFTVRLEDPDSEHFRVSTLEAKDADAAKAWAEEHERKLVAYELSDDDLDAIEKRRKRNAGELRGADKGRKFAHEQSKPYVVKSVKEGRG
jgi:hypothetical protein